MSQYDRRTLFRLFAGGGILASSACGALGQRGGGTFDMRLRWNAPENLASARRQPPPTHFGDLYFRGPALSPDGRYMAVTLPLSPVNEVAIIDVTAKTGWVLAHPNSLVKLAHPSFSPDGRRVALVVTPPTYFGSSEIWIAPIEGGVSEVISDQPMGCFTCPQFSRDGQRLICFGDANQSVPDDNPELRSYRTGVVQLALFEVDIRSKEKTRLTRQAWGWGRLAAYGPRDDGFFLSVGLASDLERTASGEIWVANTRSSEALDRGRLGFFIRRGEEPSRTPRGVLPASDSATLLGVTAEGRLLISDAQPNPNFESGNTIALRLCSNETCSDVFSWNDVQYKEGTVSLDGNVIAGRIVRTLASGDERAVPSDYHLYSVRDAEGTTTFMAPNDVVFGGRQLLVAHGASELAE